MMSSSFNLSTFSEIVFTLNSEIGEIYLIKKSNLVLRALCSFIG